MDWGSWHCIGGRDQDHPHGKEMQKSKMAVWGGLTNSCEKKRSEKQGEKERYKHLNAQFQSIARRDKKAFLSDQCKEIEVIYKIALSSCISSNFSISTHRHFITSDTVSLSWVYFGIDSTLVRTIEYLTTANPPTMEEHFFILWELIFHMPFALPCKDS